MVVIRAVRITIRETFNSKDYFLRGYSYIISF